MNKQEKISFINDTAEKYIRFGKLLQKSRPFEYIHKVNIFDRSFFDADFNRLQLLYYKIATLIIKLPTFPRKRYLSIKSSGEGGIPIEIDGIQLIDDLLDMVWKIGKRVSTLIQRRERNTSDDIIHIPGIGYEEPIDIRSARKASVIIPYGNILIEEDDLFFGRTIIDSLSYISSICYLSSFYFYNETIHTLLKQENTINQKLKKKWQYYYGLRIKRHMMNLEINWIAMYLYDLN